MKSFLLTLLICSVTYSVAHSCRCQTHREFSRTIDANNQIFIGKAISQIAVPDSVKFQFDVIKKWKGNISTQSTIELSTSNGSCGVKFEVGETYVIYANNGSTNICNRNKKLSETFDDRLLDHYILGKPIAKNLDEKDQRILQNKVLPDAGSTDNMAVVYDYRVLSPKEVYTLHPMQFKKDKYMLIELTEEEKASIGGCIDRVIIMGYVIPKKGWKRKKALSALRKKSLCK